MPVLLYGCENWILTDSLLHKLETFQAEIGHRMLQLSRYHSCLSTHLALQWPSVTTRILVEKLCLLSKVCQDGGTIGSQIYSALKEDKGHSLMLIQECQSLEGKLASHGVTDTIINNQSTLKKQLLKKDWECCVVQASRLFPEPTSENNDYSITLISTTSVYKHWLGVISLTHSVSLSEY